MSITTSFEQLQVIGKLSPSLAATKLREIGEAQAADELDQYITLQERQVSFGAVDFIWPFQDKAWQYTSHAFGYIAPAPPDGGMEKILHAGNIVPDASLKNASVRITLDRLRVASYPGGNTHRILLDFYARNQVAGGTEDLHFNATYRVFEGQQAGVIGYPIFVGLNVGSEGLAFKCFTVNVKNDDDEKFLSFLDSDVFKAGLKLSTVVQPALAAFTGMAVGITKGIAERNRNVPVQEFYMGLDFSNSAAGARLAEGSYLAVQIPDTNQTQWDWNAWAYNRANGQVVSTSDANLMIPYNYIIFSIVRHTQD